MRPLLVGAVAAAALALGVPAASAHDNSQVTSLCTIHQSVDVVVGGLEYYLAGVAVTPEAGAGTFRCEIRVNGTTEASSIYHHSEHAWLSAGPLRGWTSDLDLPALEVCAVIDWDDNDPSYESCAPAADVLTQANDFLNEHVLKPTDVITCTVLAALAPGVPGVVDIDPTGDVIVQGTPFWDCPPYAS